ncbi:MAG: hypothetical protein ACJ71L_01715 [Nitrososphaeraceae archaeon]
MRYNESRYAHWNVFTADWGTTIYVWFYNECNHRISHAKYNAKGLSSFLGGGGSGGSGSSSGDAGGLKSALSGLGGLNRDHPLVQHVQQNAGIQDPDQATQYTQHGVNLLNEQADSNPQGMQSRWVLRRRW